MRFPVAGGAGARLAAGVAIAAAAMCAAQTAQSPAAQEPTPAASAMVLDHAIAVVNRHLILASDLDDEIRLSILDPNNATQAELTRQDALEKLISRTLIEQQIRQEDMPAIEPTPDEVTARLGEIRAELPVCQREKCVTEAGWKRFLAGHGLTEQRVEAYLRYRLEILRFIEQRFRQGIQISDQQIASYYQDTLLPQYAPGETAPSLDEVTPRIQEILLQQQVNVLFDNWLTNLRQQGDVEVLDRDFAPEPAPQTPSAPQAAVSGSGAEGRSR